MALEMKHAGALGNASQHIDPETPVIVLAGSRDEVKDAAARFFLDRVELVSELDYESWLSSQEIPLATQ